ncbi:MAG: POTRA domain-containing protein [Bacteroidota bacterium]
MKKYSKLLLLGFIFTSSLEARWVSDSILIVDDIQILGNHTTKEYVILREMSIHPGDTLTQEAIERDRNNIYNLGLFNKVDVEYSVRQNIASIFVIVSERWYFIPYPILGMKYRDPSKLYYGAGVMHQNFRGRNEKVYASFGFGYDRWSMLNYQNPKVTDNDDIYFSGAFAVQKVHNLGSSYGEYENSNIFLNGTIGKRFGLYQTFFGTAGYEVWQVNEPQLNRTVSSSGRDAFLTASVQYRYDTRDNREYTTDGSLISLGIGKSGFGESEMNLTGCAYDIRQFFGFNSGSSIGVRTIGSFTWGGVIPPYRHVFFGYDERIRGYFYKTLEAENRIGMNAELRLPILTPRYLEIEAFGIPQFQKLRYGLYFAIFADAGKLWSRHQVLSEQPWYSGVGAGFQFLLPYAFNIQTGAAVNNLGTTEGFIDFDTSF